MEITNSAERLDTSLAWARLIRLLGGNDFELARNIIRHLRTLNVKSYVLEEPYIDRDYSTDYAQFYALTFHTHNRYCKRVHFFSQDISPYLQQPLSAEQLNCLSEIGKESYCGFCVIRPLPTAPIGRTVLLARISNGFNMEATVTCRANFKTHLLGTQLSVAGTAFLQQDTRVGACAQVAIWVGMRQMHARHNYNWTSVADITRFANPPSVPEAMSLPNSSDRLSTDAMIRAIANAGYQPLCFTSAEISHAILPYVESGIPIILGLNIAGGTIGHAVTVVGRVFAKQKNPTNRAMDYVPAFIVHDDQNGPYMWLPTDENASKTYAFGDKTIKRDSPNGPIELNVKHHAVFAAALMSTRVFSTAARAEHNAWSQIQKNLKALPRARKVLEDQGLPVNDMLLDELQVAYSAGKIVLRTYLTSAAGYRRHLAQGSASDELKDALLQLHLPHFTWVTEISTVDSYNQPSPGMRRIYGHTVLDATSTAEIKSGLLVLHFPGLLITRDPNARIQEKVIVIENDQLYECREKRL